MGIFFNGIGFVAALGAIIIVANTALNWQGSQRSGLFLFMWGFAFFAVGFLFNLLGFKIFTDYEMIFFAMGMIFALWGAKKILAFGEKSVTAGSI